MSGSPALSRRGFPAAGAGYGLNAMFWGTHRARAGANNRVRIAVIGIHGMSQSHIRSYAALPAVEVAALCDVDENLFPDVIDRHFAKKDRRPPTTYTDCGGSSRILTSTPFRS